MGRKQKLSRVKGTKVSPNVSERTRVNAALDAFKKGETKASIHKQFGLPITTLTRYIKHYNIQAGDAIKVNHELIARGRPNQVKKIVGIMKRSVSVSKASLKQQHTLRSYTKEAQKLLQANQVNALNILKKVSKSTFTRAHIESCGTEKVKCSESYAARAFGILDWRNAIGVCCLFFCFLFLRKEIFPWNLWSFDDVAVVANPTTQRLQIVRISKEEKKRLNQLHLTPGAMPQADKETEASNVVYKMFNCVNAEGGRGPVITKFLDHDFKWPDKEDQWLCFYCVNEGMQLYVACVNRNHPKYCEIEYFEQLFIKVIIPYLKMNRNQRAKQRSRGGVYAVHSQQSMSPQGAATTEVVINFDGDRIVITMDGYYPGIEAIIRTVGKILQEEDIDALKWAGGCSLVEQPADCADNHKNVHKEVAGDEFKYDENGAPTERVKQFIAFLETILTKKGKRLHTHQKFLRHYEWLVDKAWSKRGITEGWRLSGMWPFDAAQILSGWGGWQHIPTEKAQQIIQLCTDPEGEAFREIAKDKYLDDKKAGRIFGHLIEDDEFKRFMSDKPSTTAPTNMRSLMLTSKLFDLDCSFMEKIWEQRRVSAVRLQAARGELVGGIQMCICGAKLPKEVGKHLDTRLHKDNCRKKGIDDVPDEPEGVSETVEAVVPSSIPPVQRHLSRSEAAVSPLHLNFELEELGDSDAEELAAAA